MKAIQSLHWSHQLALLMSQNPRVIKIGRDLLVHLVHSKLPRTWPGSLQRSPMRRLHKISEYSVPVLCHSDNNNPSDRICCVQFGNFGSETIRGHWG